MQRLRAGDPDPSPAAPTDAALAPPTPYRPGALLRAAGAVPGVRRVLDQIDAHAGAWHEHNLGTLAGSAPQWLALGDSTAQGVGAASIDGGYVGQLREHLAAAGHDLPLVNLSRTGARIAHVVDVQVPAAVALGGAPRLVTCSIGANDVMRDVRTPRLLRSLLRLFDELAALAPPGCVVVVATVPASPTSLNGRMMNRVIRREADAHGFRVADVQRAFAPPLAGKLASDRFHPNERGYAEFAAAFADALAATPLAPRTRRVEGEAAGADE